MRTLLFTCFVLALPLVAAAQPAGDPSSPPGAGPPPPPPQQPMPPPQQPQPVMQPMYVMPPPPVGFAAHRGVTFEANLGLGFVHASSSGNSNNSDAALAGADIGVGGWLTPQLALTGRISGVDVTESGETSTGTIVAAFFGPSLQFWVNEHAWIGGGAGLATFRQVTGCTSDGTDACGYNGFGLDVRAGYSFGDSQHTFNVSGEITPGFYSINGSSGTITGFALLVGYQYL